MYLPAVLLAITIGFFFGEAEQPTGDFAQIDQFILDQQIDIQSADWKTRLPKPEPMVFAQNKDYFWHLKTNHGELKIKFYPDVAPMHVSSTIYLTRLGFYDNLIFHRIIPGFMAQGGDPLGTGRGDPGYRYQGEYAEHASHNKAGILSMANAGPDTDGSQFFITFRPTPHLNGRHTVFGEVVDGLSTTLPKLEMFGSRRGVTTTPVIIEQATIEVVDKG